MTRPPDLVVVHPDPDTLAAAVAELGGPAAALDDVTNGYVP